MFLSFSDVICESQKKDSILKFDVLVAHILKYLCDRNRVIFCKGLDRSIQYIDMAIP